MANGIFPNTGEELLRALDDGLDSDDPLAEQRTFIAGKAPNYLLISKPQVCGHFSSLAAPARTDPT
ncbi:MAG: hypothetical protein U5R31_16965 [Acidimicrobiia bacterium]|nr:hypothetical protein [Acidimicrobiia bacterium]